MENKVVYKGKIIETETLAGKTLYLDMPRKPEDDAFPLFGALGTLTMNKIFKPYLGKDISITIEKKEGKVHSITIQEE
jgi:hypothetical protein